MLPKFKEKLYDRVIDHILEEPKRMNMDRWCTNPNHVESKRTPACGTVACFGGWAVALSQHWKYAQLNENYWSLAQMAREALGLTKDESDVLFIPQRWPIEYLDRLDKHSPGSKSYAKVVAKFATEFKATIKASRKSGKE